mmetsp:Transcript_38974/g.122954  ORF Transcript_38974/g.122954 Transcript_38974/m.122954 type:complete len:117 (-) Transcript_38974:86-436(-)
MQKMFENNFLQRVKDLRKALHESTVKHLSQHKSTPVGIRTILNVSDQRISRVIEEIDRIPVEETLHIEVLRMLVENSKLRLALNGYSHGMLEHALVTKEKEKRESSDSVKLGILGF